MSNTWKSIETMPEYDSHTYWPVKLPFIVRKDLKHHKDPNEHYVYALAYKRDGKLCFFSPKTLEWEDISIIFNNDSEWKTL